MIFLKKFPKTVLNFFLLIHKNTKIIKTGLIQECSMMSFGKDEG